MPMESMKLESAEVQVDAGDAGLMQNVHDRCPELVGRDQIDVPGDGQAYPTGCAGGLVDVVDLAEVLAALVVEAYRCASTAVGIAGRALHRIVRGIVSID